MKRYVHFASRLTGWNAIKSRVEQLGLSMSDAQVKVCTAKIKALADVRPIAIDDADSIIRTFHGNLQKNRDDPLLPNMTAEEQKKFQAKEKELDVIGEKRELEKEAEADADVPAAKKARTEVAA